MKPINEIRIQRGLKGPCQFAAIKKGFLFYCELKNEEYCNSEQCNIAECGQYSKKKKALLDCMEERVLAVCPTKGCNRIELVGDNDKRYWPIWNEIFIPDSNTLLTGNMRSALFIKLKGLPHVFCQSCHPDRMLKF